MSTDTTPQAMDAAKAIVGSIQGPSDYAPIIQDVYVETVARIIDSRFAPLLAERDALRAALADIVEFCDDPDGSEKGESLGLGMARLLEPARAALAQGRDK